MDASTIVVAILMTMTPNTDTLQLVAAPAQMPIEQCLEQAEQVNSDPTTPYIMLCGPLIEETEPELGV